MEKSGEDAEALSAYERAIELRSDLYQGMSLRETVPERTSSAGIANLNSNFPEAWYRRGIILKKMSRYVEAIASFDRVIQSQENSVEAWYEKARCYALQDNAFLAVQNLKQVLKSKNNWSEIIAREKDFDLIRQTDSFQQALTVDRSQSGAKFSD